LRPRGTEECHHNEEEAAGQGQQADEYQAVAEEPAEFLVELAVRG
jgi:hypothetical protein